VVGAEEIVHGPAGGDGVLGVAAQACATPGDAGDLSAQSRVAVEFVEQRASVPVHVDLVAGNEGAGDAEVVGE
jgi:hypothetical protein